MRYAGHIMRGSSGPLHLLILEGLIQGTRDRGQQRKKWTDDIIRYSKSKTYEEMKRKTKDRKFWRTMVANLRNEDGTS